MIDTFGADLGLGYDIGCRFKSTLNKSSLGPKARIANHTCLVGAFHGHAHNRLCQLSFLATYVEGLGLEDLEGCERFFSLSNALAKSTRYASTFHRRQAIVEYAKHKDTVETYQNLSKCTWAPRSMILLNHADHYLGTFLLNNYKQALEILDTRSAVNDALVKVGCQDMAMVKEWLKEEERYLRGLSKEPLEETLEMEYYKLLLNLGASE
jgi:hypothetical protein